MIVILVGVGYYCRFVCISLMSKDTGNFFIYFLAICYLCVGGGGVVVLRSVSRSFTPFTRGLLGCFVVVFKWPSSILAISPRHMTSWQLSSALHIIFCPPVHLTLLITLSALQKLLGLVKHCFSIFLCVFAFELQSGKSLSIPISSLVFPMISFSYFWSYT